MKHSFIRKPELETKYRNVQEVWVRQNKQRSRLNGILTLLKNGNWFMSRDLADPPTVTREGVYGPFEYMADAIVALDELVGQRRLSCVSCGGTDENPPQHCQDCEYLDKLPDIYMRMTSGPFRRQLTRGKGCTGCGFTGYADRLPHSGLSKKACLRCGDTNTEFAICSVCKTGRRVKNGLIEYHDWPPPCRALCRGAQKPPLTKGTP